MTIRLDIQKPETTEFVELFTLDISKYSHLMTVDDPTIYRFVQAAYESGDISFGGNVYTPFDVVATGFKWDGQGPIPVPKLSLSNTNMLFNSLLNRFNQLRGCKVTRIRTFKKFLDGEPGADSTKHFPLDIYYIDRLENRNLSVVELELKSLFDQQGRRIPGRLVLRDVCTHSYRRWNATTSAFDYTKASCPYTGTNYFDKDNVSRDNPALDSCARRLSACKLRFGANAELPTRAFPGAAKAVY